MRLFRHPLTLWLFAIVLCAGFASLGFWQLDRRAQKLRMIAAVDTVLRERHAQPRSEASRAPVDGDFATAYTWAGGEGRFADAPPVLLDNQQRDGRVGVRAYRLFLPAQGEPLLVELGWLPLPGDRRMPEVLRPQAERVAGLLMPPPSHGLAAPVIEPRPDGALLAAGLERARVRDALHLRALAPRVLRLDPALHWGYARDLDILPNTLPPERHLGYAVQWFGLAAAVPIAALLLTLRARRARRQEGLMP